jgi:type I restriction enzyme M protein
MDKQDETKQEKINSVVWNACDTFRSVMSSSSYKDYILIFLFLKYLSDVWKDKYEEYKKELGDDPERIIRKMNRERFVLPENNNYDFLYENRNSDNIGQLINEVLENIEEANKEKLTGVFRGVDFNSENLGDKKDRKKRLKLLIEDFSNDKLDLRPSKVGIKDIIGNVYEYLIAKFASDGGQKGGEFFTPAEVSLLLARLVQPKAGNRIYDPACGSGSLLIKVANEVGSENCSIYGQESNGGTWALCKMNMFLHNKDTARIEWGDTLGSPKLIENDNIMKFDVVVANPPFSLDKWGAENAVHDQYHRFFRGTPPKSKGDYAFITHMIESTVENTGKVGVVVPHGVLFRGSSEGKIRKALIEENLLDAVIGLPQNLFFGTGIPGVILIFKKGRTTKDVLFIDASKEFEPGKNQNKLNKDNIEKILQTYIGYISVDKFAYRASFDEINANEFNLNIPLYVKTFEEEDEINVPELQSEIELLEDELLNLRKQMKDYLVELGLG